MMMFLAVYLGCAIFNFALLAFIVYNGWTDAEGDSVVAAVLVMLGPIGTLVWLGGYMYVLLEMTFRKLYARGRK